jgi:L-seryl-tRNA(Ser) seleniumtransferase
MDNVYERLGVPRAINGAGTLTRLSGSIMPDEVLDAMRAAARSFVRIDQLQVAVGKRIAALTGSEAGLVTSGAAAALTLAAAACIARDDFALMERLPDTAGIPNEIVVPRSHRNGYDHALRAAGARLVEVGIAERTRDPQAWEIEAAINSRTVAIACAHGFSALDLRLVAEVAHHHHLPLIVDASAALPPKRNLQAFIDLGADLVVYSGGKGLRGPQASGILCGKKVLVASAALQMWDLDYVPELWNPPDQLIPADWVARGVPNHGIGRAMKVGREEIVGLWAALERFVLLDEAAECERCRRRVASLQAALRQQNGLIAELMERSETWPLLRLIVTDAAPITAIDLLRRLEAGEPPIHLGQADALSGVLTIDPVCLRDEEVATVAQRILALLVG